MNKTVRIVVLMIGVAACALMLAEADTGGESAQAPAKAKLPKNLAGLSGPFDLGGELALKVRDYVQESQVVRLGFDGKRMGVETYVIKLRLVPAELSGKDGDEYTVQEASVKLGDQAAETIPELAGWTYVYRRTPSGMDEKGQVFGIPHAKFESLTTSAGRKLSGISSYPVYNSFIDFHGFHDAFARPAEGGGGIQDLKEVGQSIRHAAAFTEPPVNVGKGIKEGSVFRNGDVRLVFKGVGVVDGAACAVIGFDSGESTLKMIVPMSPEKDIVTVGGSEYIGDIYIDLATRWVRRITLDEFVITETQMPGVGPGPGQALGQKLQACHVRHLLTRLITK
jgi:hypothetical protein